MQNRVMTEFDYSIINHESMPTTRFSIAEAELLAIFQELFVIARRIMPAPALHVGVSHLSTANRFLQQIDRHPNTIHLYGIPDASLMGVANAQLHKLRHNSELSREYFMLVYAHSWQILIAATRSYDGVCEAIITQDAMAINASIRALNVNNLSLSDHRSIHNELTAQLMWHLASTMDNVQQTARHIGELSVPLGFTWVLQQKQANYWDTVAEAFKSLSHAMRVQIYRLSVAERVLMPLAGDSETISLQTNSPLTRAIFSNQVIRDQQGATQHTVLPIVEAEQVWGVISLESDNVYSQAEIDTFNLLVEIIRLAMQHQPKTRALPDVNVTDEAQSSITEAMQDTPSLYTASSAETIDNVVLSGKYVLEGLDDDIAWPDLDDFEQAYFGDNFDNDVLSQFDIASTTSYTPLASEVVKTEANEPIATNFDLPGNDRVETPNAPIEADFDLPGNDLIQTLMDQQRQYTELEDEALHFGPSEEHADLYKAFAIDMGERFSSEATNETDVLSQFTLPDLDGDTLIAFGTNATDAQSDLTFDEFNFNDMDVLAAFDLPDLSPEVTPTNSDAGGFADFDLHTLTENIDPSPSDTEDVLAQFDLPTNLDDLVPTSFETQVDTPTSFETEFSPIDPSAEIAAELAAANAEMETLQAEVNALRQELAQAQQTNVQLDISLQQEIQQRQHIKAELDRVQRDYETLQTAHNLTQAQQEQLKADYENLKAAQDQLTQEIEQLKQINAALEEAKQNALAISSSRQQPENDQYFLSLMHGMGLFASRLSAHIGQLKHLEKNLPSRAYKLVDQVNGEILKASEILKAIKQQAAHSSQRKNSLKTVLENVVKALQQQAKDRDIVMVLPDVIAPLSISEEQASRAFYNVIFGILHIADPRTTLDIAITETASTSTVDLIFTIDDRWKNRLDDYIHYFNQGVPQSNSFSFANVIIWQMHGSMSTELKGKQQRISIEIPKGH